MKLLSHIALTAPLAGITAYWAGLEPAACLYGGAVLIDVDHFIFYVMRTGRYNPVEMFSWYEENDKLCSSTSYYGLNILHTVEPFLLIAFAASIMPILSWVLLGMGYHLLLDYIWIYRHPVLNVKVRALSWTEHIIRRRRGEREFWRNKQAP